MILSSLCGNVTLSWSLSSEIKGHVNNVSEREYEAVRSVASWRKMLQQTNNNNIYLYSAISKKIHCPIALINYCICTGNFPPLTRHSVSFQLILTIN